MFRKLFATKTNSIASAAVIVASFSVLSRVVGFIRDRILAGEFGASADLDVYFAAFRLPDLFYQLLVVGALSASFIPIFTKYFEKKETDEAWRLTSNVLNIIIIALGAFALIAAALAHPISILVAPGFTEAQLAVLVPLTRIIMLAQFFLGISMVFGSALQGAKRFLLYSLAPIFYNLGIIFGVLIFYPLFGISGLAWGVVLGAFCHMAIQWVGLIALGYRHTFVFAPTHPDSFYIFKHMPPRVMGLAITQVNLIAMTAIASFLTVGSVTMFQFAYNLNFFPIGVIGVSYAIAAFPTLCEAINRDKLDRFVAIFSATIRQMLLFIIPATVLFILLRAQIVRLVLGAGEFDWAATVQTSDTLGWLAISFVPQGATLLLVRGFFARGNTMTPFVVSIFSVLLNILSAIFLSKTFGVIGLGMAYSLANFFQVAALWISLRLSVGTLDERRIAKSIFVLSAAAVICAAVTQSIKTLVGTSVPLETFFEVLVQFLMSSAGGLLAFGATAYLLKSEELLEFMASMRRRLFRKAKVEEPISASSGLDGA